MKKIGMLGGMSWESSLEYYRIMNELVKERLGASHSVYCLMVSVDFDEVEKLQHQGAWDQLTQIMVDEAMNLKNAGAECIVICTNTMHMMAPDIEAMTGLPVIHIADVTADEVLRRQVKKVLLLGTKFTMQGDFYKKRMEAKGVEVYVPEAADQEVIHKVIYNELILGDINEASKQAYINIINKSVEKGIEGVILGCTEIPLLIKDEDVSIEVFDTTAIHAKAAIEFSIR